MSNTLSKLIKIKSDSAYVQINIIMYLKENRIYIITSNGLRSNYNNIIYTKLNCKFVYYFHFTTNTVYNIFVLLYSVHTRENEPSVQTLRLTSISNKH